MIVDLPIPTITTFANDTAVLALHGHTQIALENLQNHLNTIKMWYKSECCSLQLTTNCHNNAKYGECIWIPI